jgi:hypothetical protein
LMSCEMSCTWVLFQGFPSKGERWVCLTSNQKSKVCHEQTPETRKVLFLISSLCFCLTENKTVLLVSTDRMSCQNFYKQGLLILSEVSCSCSLPFIKHTYPRYSSFKKHPRGSRRFVFLLGWGKKRTTPERLYEDNVHTEITGDKNVGIIIETCTNVSKVISVLFKIAFNQNDEHCTTTQRQKVNEEDLKRKQ